MKKIILLAIYVVSFVSCSKSFDSKEKEAILKSKLVMNESVQYKSETEAEVIKIEPKATFKSIEITGDQKVAIEKAKAEFKAYYKDGSLEAKLGEVTLEFIAPVDGFKSKEDKMFYTQKSLDELKEYTYSLKARKCTERSMFGGCANFAPLNEKSKEAQQVRKSIEEEFLAYKPVKKNDVIETVTKKFRLKIETINNATRYEVMN